MSGNSNVGITKLGGGTTLTLSGTNSYTGGTIISAGTLKLGASGVIPDSSATVVNGTLDLAGYSETIGSLSGVGTITSTAAGTPTLTVTQGADATFSGVIQNGSATSVSLTKAGSSSLTLTSTNTYTGGTNVNAGILILDHTSTGTVLADTGAVTINGGTLQLNDTTESVGAVTLTSGSITVGTTGNTLTGTSYTLNPSSLTTHTISAVLAGSGALTSSSSGTATVT
ncbi:MAG: autotransporter domain-containing protein, partial [Betaproteobacteria bacterium]|nr:autotransporter domain-containing protein [Betaproteobacteria bacterium]